MQKRPILTRLQYETVFVIKSLPIKTHKTIKCFLCISLGAIHSILQQPCIMPESAEKQTNNLCAISALQNHQQNVNNRATGSELFFFFFFEWVAQETNRNIKLCSKIALIIVSNTSIYNSLVHTHTHEVIIARKTANEQAHDTHLNHRTPHTRTYRVPPRLGARWNCSKVVRVAVVVFSFYWCAIVLRACLFSPCGLESTT